MPVQSKRGNRVKPIDIAELLARKARIAWRGLSSALVVVFLVGACAQPELPKDNFYRLQVIPAQSDGNKLFADGIEVERFVADGLTANRTIDYSASEHPNQLREYHYHFWTESPVVMLRDQLVDYLRQAGIADRIVTPELRGNARYALIGKIKRLEKVVGSQPRAVLELELGLLEDKTGQLIFLDSYRVEKMAASGSVGDAVVALNQGLSEIFAHFVADLKAL